MPEEKLTEDEKNALLAIHKHLACLKQSGYSHAGIVVEQVLVLLELSNVKIWLESISAALGGVVEFIQQKRRGAAWQVGVIIRDLERLTANFQHAQAGHAAGQGTLHTAPQHPAAPQQRVPQQRVPQQRAPSQRAPSRRAPPSE
ncbi:MAG: hypothetical protein FWC28_03425 [Proteobacteria bacterium]|nr:hypothetical protein [Cystobacterineae bacterium]MCL2314290.1 hypothetical protein [Pseudomonadota bacterium]